MMYIQSRTHQPFPQAYSTITNSPVLSIVLSPPHLTSPHLTAPHTGTQARTPSRTHTLGMPTARTHARLRHASAVLRASNPGPCRLCSVAGWDGMGYAAYDVVRQVVQRRVYGACTVPLSRVARTYVRTYVHVRTCTALHCTDTTSLHFYTVTCTPRYRTSSI